ncbi:MipA/OmpV family protein [Pseudomonas corrugata]|uniref:MipA/OmpV family protein n=1 Tax=Pseudomonas corrugata TaxID=47879 RepID=UPI002231AF9B|nr:MipA/OmpV family protein [Pseudomonas corrugata]UZD97738.1 MipA/OmpV family protein [Pseudomonas corrugata]
MNRKETGSKSSWKVAKVLLASTALLASGAGYADSSNQDSDKTDVTLGLGVGIMPRYMGADNYRSLVLPMLSVQRGVLFADSTRGIGLQWKSSSGLSASAAVNYDFGRSDKNTSSRYGSNELKGMGAVDGSTVADFTLGQELLPWLSVSGEAELRIAGEHRGNRYRLGFEGIAFHTDADTVALDLDAHAGDGRYNQTYFGVSDAQSQLSRFSTFRADSGIYAYSAALNWLHTFDPHWSASTSLMVTHYTDQVRDSSLVSSDAETMAMAALNYTF